jgi:hypothetical protein
VWVGVFQQKRLPTLTWELDGKPIAPRTLRRIASVRPNDMLPANKQPHEVARAFTGVYEFAGLEPDTPYVVTVHAGGDRQTLSAQTLPTAIPQGFDGWFNVLLVSCFHQAEDRAGRVGQLVAHLQAGVKPHLSLLMGDQVYLDLPTLQNFPDNTAWMAQKFEDDYTTNWWGPPGYGHVLATAPSVSIPDDHEYWNNFPNAATVAQNTWTAAGRDRWRRAAEAMYKGFQLPYPLKLGDPFILDVPPVSFFLADLRPGRSEGTAQLMTPAAYQQLDNWVTRLIAQGRFGVFVSGQSLFAEPVGKLAGSVGDYQLADYDDFPRLVRSLMRLTDAGLPLVCLTGDVHWGRFTQAVDTRSGRKAVHEVISSPASLVTMVGLDQINRLRSTLGELIGRSKPWPRHPRPQMPSDFFAQQIMGSRFFCPPPSEAFQQYGNQVAMLGFRQMGGGLDMRVMYYEISLDGQIVEPKILGPFALRAT